LVRLQLCCPCCFRSKYARIRTSKVAGTPSAIICWAFRYVSP